MALRKRAARKERNARPAEIRFKHGALSELRERLLEDLTRESFAVLFGKLHRLDSHDIITVHDWWPSEEADYNQRSLAFLNIDRSFIHQALVEVTNRLDVDTLIDVHTHPFSDRSVSFSGVDDRDERRFCEFLTETFDNLYYASIVLSQSSYSARTWNKNRKKATASDAVVVTATRGEALRSSNGWDDASEPLAPMFERSASALGLDVLRTFARGQRIVIVGVGGLGSIIAEHVAHMGFNSIALIDNDRLEISNLNRIVGATYKDAEDGKLKVEAIGAHLRRINPNAEIITCADDVRSESASRLLASATWVLLATDNHSSRYFVQQQCLPLFIPLISAGVNITVDDDRVTDMSGEVITVRPGDRLCLSCLGRIDPTKLAFEENRGAAIGDALIARGYVTGASVKEPAVKTLNSYVATLAVDTLVNQFTNRVPHIPVCVFDGTHGVAFYADEESVAARNKRCFDCDI